MKFENIDLNVNEPKPRINLSLLIQMDRI